MMVDWLLYKGGSMLLKLLGVVTNPWAGDSQSLLQELDQENKDLQSQLLKTGQLAAGNKRLCSFIHSKSQKKNKNMGFCFGQRAGSEHMGSFLMLRCLFWSHFFCHDGTQTWPCVPTRCSILFPAPQISVDLGAFRWDRFDRLPTPQLSCTWV